MCDLRVKSRRPRGMQQPLQLSPTHAQLLIKFLNNCEPLKPIIPLSTPPCSESKHTTHYCLKKTNTIITIWFGNFPEIVPWELLSLPYKGWSRVQGTLSKVWGKVTKLTPWLSEIQTPSLPLGHARFSSILSWINSRISFPKPWISAVQVIEDGSAINV